LAKQQQHRGPDVSGINAAETAVQLVQRLSTPRAVCCMAASAEAGLLAAGGTGGWAYVWPLLPAAPEQQLVGAVDTTATAAAVDADAAAGAWRSKAAGGMRQPPPYQQQQAAAAVADAGGMIELPQAAYRGIALPEISELCFVLQPGATHVVQWAVGLQQQSLCCRSSPCHLTHAVCSALSRGCRQAGGLPACAAAADREPVGTQQRGGW
jgi:hypothetical protein